MTVPQKPETPTTQSPPKSSILSKLRKCFGQKVDKSVYNSLNNAHTELKNKYEKLEKEHEELQAVVSEIEEIVNENLDE